MSSGPVNAGLHQVAQKASAPAWLQHAGRTVAAHETELIVAAGLCLAAVLALIVVRSRRGARLSAERLRVVVVPTESFDPSMEALLRVAIMLAQARTPLPLLTPRHCQAIWVRLVDKDGDLAFLLETGQWRASAVRSSLLAESELYPLDVLEKAAQPATPLRSPASPRDELDDDVVQVAAGRVGPGGDVDKEGHDMAELVEIS